VIGDVEMDRGKPSTSGIGLAERAWEEAGRATKTDRILVLGATEAGRRRALASADLPIDWTWPPTRLRAI
jgi:hypothetical protein